MADYTLTFEPRAGYLYAHVEGEHDTLEISFAYWTAISAECRRRATRRLLVVEALTERSSPIDMYQIAVALVELGFANIRIAYVDVALEDMALLQFGETVARSRGIDGRVFNTVADAEEWLVNDTEASAA